MKNNNRILRKGDTLFARLYMGRKVIAEGMLTGVDSTTELLARVRAAAKGHVGLATLFVRSVSRGWETQRPLRLYSEPMPIRTRISTSVPLFHWDL